MMVSIKKYFIPTIFILPMVLHWILPWGMESRLYITIGSISFFLPDALYIIYLLWYNARKETFGLPLTKRAIFLSLAIIITIYSWNILIGKNVDYIPNLLLNNLSFVWLPLIYLFAPLTPRQIQLTKPVLLGAFLILVGEVLLYSMGILHYTTEAGNTLRGQDFGGVMRISTTVGGATGTALIIGMLGAIIVSVYKFQTKYKILLFLLTSLGVYFTMSRGTSVLWTLYAIYYFYTKYFKHIRLGKKVKALFCVICLIGIFYKAGGFNPVLSRYELMEKSRDASAGRNAKWNISMRMIDESSPWGYGLGQVLPEKAIEMFYRAPYHFAPHNVYTLIAIELGLPGIVLFVAYLGMIISCISFKSPLSMYIILALIINANTETFLIDSEAFSLFMFAVMTVTKYKYTPLRPLQSVV